MIELSITSVLSWARTKSPSETYEYADITSCPLAQFLREHGASQPFVTAKFWQRSPVEPLRVLDVELNEAVGCEPCEFGALVTRLERAMPQAARATHERSQSPLSPPTVSVPIAERVQ